MVKLNDRTGFAAVEFDGKQVRLYSVLDIQAILT